MRIHLIYTGGTIGMVHGSDGTLVPYDFTDLLDRVPELGSLGTTLCTSVLEPIVDSSDMDPSDWTRLAELIWAEAEEADGFVVLHGTDTLAYTASALSFALLGLNLPVVITGSQLPMEVPRSDARENLITAVEVACARDAQGGPLLREVAVYFEYTLYRGNRVYKQSSQDFDAFASPNFPPLATAGVKLAFAPFVTERAPEGALPGERRAPAMPSRCRCRRRAAAHAVRSGGGLVAVLPRHRRSRCAIGVVFGPQGGFASNVWSGQFAQPALAGPRPARSRGPRHLADPGVALPQGLCGRVRIRRRAHAGRTRGTERRGRHIGGHPGKDDVALGPAVGPRCV